MYQPPVFVEDRPEVMHALMMTKPFATLVAYTALGLGADHIPLALHPEPGPHGALRGHIAVGNPLWRDADRAAGPIDVLVIFQGSQTYVTPSWYASKAEHGKVVPTWNYAVVQAHGRLRFHDDADWLMQHLDDLTSRHEKLRTNPWAVNDAPQDFLARQIKGIVGLEIEITALTGKWKFSQNRSEADRGGVVDGLRAEGTQQASAAADLVAEARR